MAIGRFLLFVLENFSQVGWPLVGRDLIVPYYRLHVLVIDYLIDS
jgi:hypothetical protein